MNGTEGTVVALGREVPTGNLGKRTMDLVASGVGLLLFLPLLVAALGFFQARGGT